MTDRRLHQGAVWVIALVDHIEHLNAIMDALDAHTTMSRQALKSESVREGMINLLLNHLGLWEALRARAGAGQP